MGMYKLRQGYRRHRLRQGILVLTVLGFAATAGVSVWPSRDTSEQALEPLTSQLSEPVADAPMPQPKIENPLPWPVYGQAAYGSVDDGVLAQSSEAAEPVPIASLAKVITALMVLEKKPLAPGEQGPMIMLTEADEELYREYIRKDGTVVQVKAGVEISQYQALQAMLLPSANNMADTLAIWAFGSVEAYSEYANTRLRELQYRKTTVADASGYSPASVGTADEMVRLGIQYLQHPVLREIAGQTEAYIPFTGRIPSYHAAINDGQLVGLKVGFTEDAGVTFIAADLRGSDHEIAVAAVLGADDHATVLRDIKTLLLSGNQEHDKLFENS